MEKLAVGCGEFWTGHGENLASLPSGPDKKRGDGVQRGASLPSMDGAETNSGIRRMTEEEEEEVEMELDEREELAEFVEEEEEEEEEEELAVIEEQEEEEEEEEMRDDGTDTFKDGTSTTSTSAKREAVKLRCKYDSGCPFLGRNRGAMRKHKPRHSTQQQQYPCPFCSFGATTSRHREFHVEQHNVEDGFPGRMIPSDDTTTRAKRIAEEKKREEIEQKKVEMKQERKSTRQLNRRDVSSIREQCMQLPATAADVNYYIRALTESFHSDSTMVQLEGLKQLKKLAGCAMGKLSLALYMREILIFPVALLRESSSVRKESCRVLMDLANRVYKDTPIGAVIYKYLSEGDADVNIKEFITDMVTSFPINWLRYPSSRGLIGQCQHLFEKSAKSRMKRIAIFLLFSVLSVVPNLGQKGTEMMKIRPLLEEMEVVDRETTTDIRRLLLAKNVTLTE